MEDDEINYIGGLMSREREILKLAKEKVNISMDDIHPHIYRCRDRAKLSVQVLIGKSLLKINKNGLLELTH